MMTLLNGFYITVTDGHTAQFGPWPLLSVS
jgi:hypothetical protein